MQLDNLMTVLPREGTNPPRAKIAYANVVIDSMPVSQVRQLLGWMVGAYRDYVDCGEVNSTELAEDACFIFNLYDGDTIPKDLYELSGAVALAHKDGR